MSLDGVVLDKSGTSRLHSGERHSKVAVSSRSYGIRHLVGVRKSRLHFDVD